ncbi:MAG: hypothetical protein HWN80_19575 [Candidatus Lokiarchaeota archaeon]|nr:hypothetical protein [Candidatus Lokiarchaeota archaeon]
MNLAENGRNDLTFHDTQIFSFTCIGLSDRSGAFLPEVGRLQRTHRATPPWLGTPMLHLTRN